MNVVNIDDIFRRANAIIRHNFDEDDDEMVEAVAAYALQLAARTDVVPTRSVLHNYDHVQFDLHNGHYWSGNGSRFYFRYISIYIYYINTKKIDSIQLLTSNACFLHSAFQKLSRLATICECQEWKHFV